MSRNAALLPEPFTGCLPRPLKDCVRAAGLTAQARLQPPGHDNLRITVGILRGRMAVVRLPAVD